MWVTDTYPNMELDVDTSSEQPDNSLTNPAVQNTINIITRNLIAMTITDISSCAALVFFTERVRRRSWKSKNALHKKYVAVQKFCYILCWLFPGDWLTCYSPVPTPKHGHYY